MVGLSGSARSLTLSAWITLTDPAGIPAFQDAVRSFGRVAGQNRLAGDSHGVARFIAWLLYRTLAHR
jgi:hypothetical protein